MFLVFDISEEAAPISQILFKFFFYHESPICDRRSPSGNIATSLLKKLRLIFYIAHCYLLSLSLINAVTSGSQNFKHVKQLNTPGTPKMSHFEATKSLEDSGKYRCIIICSALLT